MSDVRNTDPQIRRHDNEGMVPVTKLTPAGNKYEPFLFADKNAAKRFIALIDTLYDQGSILIVSAEERPSNLYDVDHGTEAFEFQRTISRLREMQSEEWLDRQKSA